MSAFNMLIKNFEGIKLMPEQFFNIFTRSTFLKNMVVLIKYIEKIPLLRLFHLFMQKMAI